MDFRIGIHKESSPDTPIIPPDKGRVSKDSNDHWITWVLSGKTSSQILQTRPYHICDVYLQNVSRGRSGLSYAASIFLSTVCRIPPLR
jgi:hypothetical protein